MIVPLLESRILGSPESNFVVAESRDEGGKPGPPRLIVPLHVHHHDDEAFYVLEGTLCVKRGEDEVEVKANSGVFVSHGTPHTFWNPGPGPARYLNIMTPRGFLLIQEINIMQDHSHAALVKVYEKCESTLLAEPSAG